jgi:hypothetical protein
MAAQLNKIIGTGEFKRVDFFKFKREFVKISTELQKKKINNNNT